MEAAKIQVRKAKEEAKTQADAADKHTDTAYARLTGGAKFGIGISLVLNSRTFVVLSLFEI
jgi:hypothetical protein